jgi:hypothetical protein
MHMRAYTATAAHVALVLANDPDADRLAAAEQIMDGKTGKGTGRFVTFSGALACVCVCVCACVCVCVCVCVWVCVCVAAEGDTAQHQVGCVHARQPASKTDHLLLPCVAAARLPTRTHVHTRTPLHPYTPHAHPTPTPHTHPNTHPHTTPGNDIGLLLADWVWTNFRRQHPEVCAHVCVCVCVCVCVRTCVCVLMRARSALFTAGAVRLPHAVAPPHSVTHRACHPARVACVPHTLASHPRQVPPERCIMLASAVSSSALASMAAVEGFRFEQTLTGVRGCCIVLCCVVLCCAVC